MLFIPTLACFCPVTTVCIFPFVVFRTPPHISFGLLSPVQALFRIVIKRPSHDAQNRDEDVIFFRTKPLMNKHYKQPLSSLILTPPSQPRLSGRRSSHPRDHHIRLRPVPSIHSCAGKPRKQRLPKRDHLRGHF